MTFALGSDATRRAVEAQMLGSYRVRHLVDLYDFDHRLVRSLTSSRMSGAVQVRTTAEGVTRSLALEMLDPTDMLNLGDGERAVTPNRMVHVRKGIFVETGTSVSTSPPLGYGQDVYGAGVYGVDVPGSRRVAQEGYWVDVPVFFGPLTKPDRADGVLSIEAQDKAAFAVGARPAFTVRAGTNVATAIRQLMAGSVGESRFRLASTTRKLAMSHTISRDQTPWALVQRICRSVNWVAFYDGDGYLVARPASTAPVVTFRRGVSLMGDVNAGYWSEDAFNQVTVVGGVISKTTITATATLPADHPLSPESLAVNGVRWFKTEVIEAPDVSTWAAANAMAADRVRLLAQQQTSVAFDARPFWHMQEHDAFSVETPDGLFTSTVQEMTIPLSSEGGQSFGANTRTMLTRRNLRIRPKSARLSRAEANARRKAASR